ncbi:MAG TPA: hypothetical protein VK919_01845 [Solirubrobacterales bacterium]|nr:hypothetical protein [Solirubrobacterales bacterium]
MPGPAVSKLRAPAVPRTVVAIALAAATTLLLACGGDDNGSDAPNGETTGGGVQQEPEAAANPRPADFPAAAGKTLQDLADEARPGTNMAPATTHYVAGTTRIAFGLLDRSNEFIYAPSAVYVGRTPGDAAEGPFVAPADSLITEKRFRSQNAALEGDAIASVYSAELELPAPGTYAILVLTRAGNELFGATSQIEAVANDPIPAPGERAPRVETDTIETVGGQIENIDTRVPPSDMHENFAEVVGTKPVALLFATPQLCQSRVCGPVTDIALQLDAEYGDEMEFIHQEVYVDNDVGKGLRDPLLEFNLPTEPWLFTVDAEGRIAARLEGSFGVSEFEQAVQAAL